MTTSKLRRLLILLFVCISATNAQFNSTIDGAVTDEVQFRAEFYTIWNCVNFSNFDTSLTSGTFAKSTATYTPQGRTVRASTAILREMFSSVLARIRVAGYTIVITTPSVRILFESATRAARGLRSRTGRPERGGKKHLLLGINLAKIVPFSERSRTCLTWKTGLGEPRQPSQVDVRLISLSIRFVAEIRKTWR